MSIIRNLICKLFGWTNNDKPLVDVHANTTNSNVSKGIGSPVITINNNTVPQSNSHSDIMGKLDTSKSGYFVERSSGNIICPRCVKTSQIMIPMHRDQDGILVCHACGEEIDDRLHDENSIQRRFKPWWIV